MAELRAQIDAIDTAVVDMLAQRTAYIDRAIALKPAEGLPARTHDRVAQVVENVRTKAVQAGWDADLAEVIWRALIEWSIAREVVHLGDGLPGPKDR